MFKKEDIESIDRKYFTVIVANEYDITLISNNTNTFPSSTGLPSKLFLSLYFCVLL